MRQPGDAEQSTKRQRQEEPHREQSGLSASSSCAADTSTDVREPQGPKLARHLPPAEREDSMQKQVLTIAWVYTGNETASCVEDQHTVKPLELVNKDKFGVVELVNRPPSQQVFSSCWVQKQRLDGSSKMRIVARGFEQAVSPEADISAVTPKFTTLRGLLTIAAVHGNPVLSETATVLSINRRCRAIQNQCT